MVDYSEILMQSMDVLVNKRLSELEFDKTIICTVIDASNAENGEYEVTDGATTFSAYSKDVTFKEEDSVYVTIPNGDYGNQKLIVGKHVSPGESLTYISPLDSFINITGDLCNFTSTASLLANSKNTITKNGESLDVPNRKTIWKATVQNGKGFERLGIQAEFKTWLKKLRVNSGNFGLCLFVSYIDKASVNAEDSVKVAQFVLDSDDMYGNPYNFESFYSQSKTFDVSFIKGQITDLELVFYQDANFGTSTGEAAPTKDSVTGNTLMDNIFVQNVQVGFGYDITKFDDDAVLIYCLNEPTYNLNNLTQENHKTLKLRWIRATNEGIYSVDAEDEIPENAEIHWYKYQLKIQDEVDELAGPLWFEIEEGRNKLTLEVDPDTTEYSQQYKAIIEVPSRQWITNQLDEEMNIDYKLLVINAEGKGDDSDEKKLLNQYEFDIQSQRKIYASEPIEFKSEVPVFDKMTADLINGLQILVDEKGYKGNYLLYNLSNQIQNSNEATKMRVMRATYKSLVTGEQTLDGAESIVWKIPLTNSMIYPPEDGKEYKSTDAATSYWVENGFAYIKRLSGKSAAIAQDPGTVSDWSCEQKFRIKDYYQESATNNTVYCYVIKNNVAYEASQEMTFGPMGTNGTDFTFRMSFESDNVGITGQGNQIIKVNLSMFDFNNEKVPNFWNNGVNISWYHLNDADKDRLYFCDEFGNKLSTAPTINADKCFYIRYVGGASIPHAAILQAQVTADPTVAAGTKVLNAVKLTCYLPIPYRANKDYCGIEGATKILYDSSGTKADYYKERYRLWAVDGLDQKEITDGVTWAIFHPSYEAGKDGSVVIDGWTYNEENPEDETPIGVEAAKNHAPTFFPRLTAANTITVPSMYTELDGKTDRDIYVTATRNGTLVWSQPIMMTRDAFSSTMLNAWDGGLTIDEENGTILSTMIGAGKKDSENRFEGVMMGDVTDAISSSTLLGLYGFNKGIQSFGWKIDGTGFIGKSGQGQIIFDGNRGTISSGIWSISKQRIGMEIDLDGPTAANKISTGSSMKMYGAAGQVEIDTSKDSKNLFVIKGRTNPVKADGTTPINNYFNFKYSDMLKISVDVAAARREDTNNKPTGTDEVSTPTSFYLQSLGYTPKGDNPKGTRLDLQNGYFYSFGQYGRIQFATGNTTFFRLADADNNVLFIIKGGTKNGSANADSDNADGTDAIATVSSYYLQSSNFNSSDKTGTRLDLQKGKYTSYGKSGRIEMAPDTNTFFRLADASNNVLFVIKTSNNDSDSDPGSEGDGAVSGVATVSQYYIQSSNFSSSDKKGTRLDLQSGKYTSYGTAGYVIIDSNHAGLFRVGAKSSDKYYNLMYVGSSSSYYIQNLAWATSSGTTGSKWNLNNGRFDAKSTGGSIAIHPDTPSGLFVVKVGTGENEKIILNVGTTYYLQSSDYNTDNHKGVRFDLATGKITAFNFQVDAYKTDGKYIKINSGAETYPLNVNGNFLVGWDGSTILKGNATLTVQSGKIQSGKDGDTKGKYYSLNEGGGHIGGWYLTSNSFQSWNPSGTAGDYSSQMGTDGTMKLDGKKWTLRLDENRFSVYPHGENGYSLLKAGIVLDSSRIDLSMDSTHRISIGSSMINISSDGWMLAMGGTTIGTPQGPYTNSGITLGKSSGTRIHLTDSSIRIEAKNGGLIILNGSAGIISAGTNASGARDGIPTIFFGSTTLSIKSNGNGKVTVDGNGILLEGDNMYLKGSTLWVNDTQSGYTGSFSVKTGMFKSRSLSFVKGILVSVGSETDDDKGDNPWAES